MKKFILFLCALITSNYLFGQIATWNGAAGSGSAGVTAGNATRGAGIGAGTGTCTNNVYTSDNFFDAGDAGGEAEAVAENEYVQFPITAQTHYTITITSVSFTSRNSDTGVKDFAIYNGSATNLGSGSQPTVNMCEDKTIDITDVVITAGNTVNFRFYGWGATNTAGNWRIAGVNFLGTSLPIELTSFRVNASKNSADLAFSTATEIDNDYFSIERSASGHDYTEIGQVKGAGTSYEPQDYTFTDERPLQGKNYYRLRQVDFDGKYSYSPVVTATFGKATQMTLAPLPASETLNIQLEKSRKDDGLWQVFDMNGRLLSSGTFFAETTTQVIHIEALPEGAYMLRLTVGQEVMVEQFRKNR